MYQKQLQKVWLLENTLKTNIIEKYLRLYSVPLSYMSLNATKCNFRHLDVMWENSANAGKSCNMHSQNNAVFVRFKQSAKLTNCKTLKGFIF